MDTPTVQDAPTHWKGILQQLGPGLIISANIVGAGELIVTTALGAEVGFTMLWFILFGCFIKVFLQVELGRAAIIHGRTTLEIFNSVPGPRIRLSWLVWVWLLMFLATFFQVSGMVGGIAQAVSLGGSTLSIQTLAVIITGSCALLLVFGSYRHIERFATFMVAGFTFMTFLAVLSLQWTPYAITGEELLGGLSFRLPSNYVLAFAAFGIIGMGASELIYYPYWCLEKGYAGKTGPNDGSTEWLLRAKGWIRILKWDAWVSMVFYTLATIAFYLLGDATLHGRGIEIENETLMENLSNLYSTSFGATGLWLFIVGAIVVLFSTVFIATASNGRMATDLLGLLQWIDLRDPTKKKRAIRYICVGLPILYCVLYLSISKPVTLVTAGAFAQALMLPFLCFAALFYLYRQTPVELRPHSTWAVFLWFSATLMTSVGCFQLYRELTALAG